MWGGHDIGRGPEEWDEILGRAMVLFASMGENEGQIAPLFKSLKFLISKAILANPEGAAATTGEEVCEESKFRV